MEVLLINSVGLLGASALLIFSFWLTRDYLTHATVFSAVWVINILVSQVGVNPLLLPEYRTLIIMYAAWWAVLGGSCLALLRASKAYGTPRSLYPLPAITLLSALIALQVICVIYEFRHLAMTSTGSIISDLVAARKTGFLAEVELPPVARTFRWASVYYIPLTFLLWKQGSIRPWVALTILVWAVFASLLRFTREPLLMTALAILICWRIVFSKKGIANMLVQLIAVLAVCVTSIQMQGSLMGGERMGYADLLDEVRAYLGGPVKAYEEILDGRFQREAGFYSLDFIYLPLSKLDLVDDYPALVRPYSQDLTTTNIYTFLDAFTLDMGVTGALIATGFLGVLFGAAYTWLRRQPDLAVLIAYSYILQGCAMSFANNEFIRFSFVFTLILGILFQFLISCPAPQCAARGCQNQAKASKALSILPNQSGR